jgi:hypothetical protein
MTVPGLDEFAVGRERRRGRASFWSTLPEAVREQLVASDAPTAVAVEWLVAQGYPATFGNVDPHRRQERRRRGL